MYPKLKRVWLARLTHEGYSIHVRQFYDLTPGGRHKERLPSAAAGLSAKQQEQVLDAHYRDIQDCLNLDEIFPHLCQHHLLTSTEKQELLNPMYTSNHKIRKLMMWIPRKGRNALHHFIICLRHSADGTGHLELADKLEKEATKGWQYTTKKGIRCLPCCQTVVSLVKVVRDIGS